MDKKYFAFSFFFLICFTSKCSSIDIDNENSRKSTGRQGKVFSLFTIVNFENGECESTSTLTSGGNRNGTCFTSSECGDKGGQAKGNCASGFGVCCIFVISDTTTSQVSNNNTYLQNPGNPAAYKETTALSYTVTKINEDVCFLSPSTSFSRILRNVDSTVAQSTLSLFRLDFEDFTINGPANSCEYDDCTKAFADIETSGGKCATDYIDIKPPSSSGQTVPQICGKNTGQHIYVSMGSGATDSASIALSFSGTSTVRKWEMKVAQIACGSSAPPDGCLQYYTGVAGQIMTFNFLDGSNTHLAQQTYTICMRREQGYCCNQYSVCDETTYPNAFSLWRENKDATAKAMIESSCSEDYISIEGGTGICSTSLPSGGNTRTKFCGGRLNAGKDAKYTTNAPVCDCSAPFEVGIVTDNTADKQDTKEGTADAALSRGICLDFKQVAC